MHDILIGTKILAKNDEIAAKTREELTHRGIFSINLVSSPGSGKTSILERTVSLLKARMSIAVVEGDIQTDLDAQRIEKQGVPVKQITTGRACHLDAHMISHELPWLFEQPGVRLFIIENVGNMVCPAEYDLGEAMKVAVMSVTEGDDKPLKYPAMFHASKCLIINKTDLAPHTDFSTERAVANALGVNPGLIIFETSCVTGEGLGEWCEYLSALAGGERQ
jgi:hydrogenase nickel incorporation protein HypB